MKKYLSLAGRAIVLVVSFAFAGVSALAGENCRHIAGIATGFTCSVPSRGAADADTEVKTFPLDGYCPVELTLNERWVDGKPVHSVVFADRTYFCSSRQAEIRFRCEPSRFAPVLQGNDVVLWANEQRLVAARRESGVFYAEKVWLSASEHSLEQFGRDPDRYLRAAGVAETRQAFLPRQSYTSADQVPNRQFSPHVAGPAAAAPSSRYRPIADDNAVPLFRISKDGDLHIAAAIVRQVLEIDENGNARMRYVEEQREFCIPLVKMAGLLASAMRSRVGLAIAVLEQLTAGIRRDCSESPQGNASDVSCPICHPTTGGLQKR